MSECSPHGGNIMTGIHVTLVNGNVLKPNESDGVIAALDAACLISDTQQGELWIYRYCPERDGYEAVLKDVLPGGTGVNCVEEMMRALVNNNSAVTTRKCRMKAWGYRVGGVPGGFRVTVNNHENGVTEEWLFCFSGNVGTGNEECALAAMMELDASSVRYEFRVKELIRADESLARAYDRVCEHM